MLNRPSLTGFIVALSLILVTAVPASAQFTGPATDAERWARSLDESSAALAKGDHAKALKISERLIREMVEILGPGDAATKFFGIVLSHKALALAGLGRRDEALWYWQTVISLYPAFAKSDLSSFGEAGAFLDRNRVQRVPRSREEIKAEEAAHRVTRPRVIKRPEPVFPRGAAWFGVEGLMIVNLVIKTDGTVASPVLLKALPAPTLNYAALDAVRKWRFAPGMVDGKVVEGQFDLTINFRLK